MKTEIKFRGKNIVTGEWVYGSLVNNLWKYSESHSLFGQPVCEIITDEYKGDCWEDIASQDEKCIVCVIPETVGQYSGLKDKNNVDIYGGEIIFNDDRNEHTIVTYSEERAMFICTYVESNDVFPLWQTLSNLYYSVGNIYENKNLLTAQ